jgi:hypothetical protein
MLLTEALQRKVNLCKTGLAEAVAPSQTAQVKGHTYREEERHQLKA